MDYISIRVTCQQSLVEYIISELFQMGFDSFQEFEDGLEGSCQTETFNGEEVRGFFDQFPNVTYKVKEQEKVNWNLEWEKNYSPVIIENKCIVRASFHEPRPEFEYEIIVTPKMSFGTGHHATTYQILAYQLKLDHRGKRVLDVGTGTGVLAIMASKRGASDIVATDIDEWCIENSSENFELNKIRKYQLYKKEIHDLDEKQFDIVIANINKNVLQTQMSSYSSLIKWQGTLLISGFYSEDIDDLIREANKHALVKKFQSVKDNWAMLVFSKQSV